jgi:hypothetical protein
MHDKDTTIILFLATFWRLIFNKVQFNEISCKYFRCRNILLYIVIDAYFARVSMVLILVRLQKVSPVHTAKKDQKIKEKSCN